MQGEIRPGYRQTEVGVIPEDWENDKLSRFVTDHRSGIYKKSANYGDGCNIVGVGDIYGISAVDGRIFDRVNLSKDEIKIFILQPGDLLYGESSLVREGIARTVYVKDGGENTAFAWHTRRYRVRQEHIDSEYLFYFLQSELARQHMMSNAIQTALTGINTVAYFSCPVLVPPLKEQRAIAAALSDADALIAAVEAMIAKKRDLKQAAMQHLLTGKTRLPGFSGEWEVKRLGDVGRALIGLTYSPSNIRKSGTLVLRSSNIQNGALAFEDNVFVESEVAQSAVIEVGDLLICARNGSRDLIGKSVRLDERARGMAFGAFMAAYRSDFNGFISYQFQSDLIKRQINEHLGATINQITNKSLLSFQIPLPADTAEQTAIAEVLSDMDADLAALEAQAAKARAVKQGMMQELLTGRVRLV